MAKIHFLDEFGLTLSALGRLLAGMGGIVLPLGPRSSLKAA